MTTHTLSLVEETRERRADPGGASLVRVLNCTRPVGPSLALGLTAADEIEVGRADIAAHSRHLRDGRRLVRLDIDDPWMSTCHFRLVAAADGGWIVCDEGSKNGTRINGQRRDRHALADFDVIDAGRSFFVYRRDGLGADLTEERAVAGQPRTTTLSATLRAEYETLARIARADVSVVVYGDSGTGKEVVARYVHECSKRTGRFIAVNCGALPETLIESELFGAAKGAYSGATDHREGLVRAASGGTLFLDEIADLPRESQATLLRVLQEAQVTPVGSTRAVPVDLRVVAATHRDLSALVAADEFRHDLYARLRGYEMTLPPLRRRREDLGLLMAVLLPEVAPRRAETITLHLRAARALLLHDWPYNVRELRQALASATAVSENDEIALDDLPRSITSLGPPATPTPDGGDNLERTHLHSLLQRHRGNVSAIARELGTSRSQVRRLAQRHGFDLGAFRD